MSVGGSIVRTGTSAVRMASLDKQVPKIYSNRPAWVAPSRKHWMVEASNQNSLMSHMAGIAITFFAAGLIVTKAGGAKYENPKTITREWANVAAQKKIGKAPIYWETRAAVSEDDY